MTNHIWYDTVSMHFVRVLLNAAKRRQLSTATMLSVAQINPAHIDIPSARIAPEQLGLCIEWLWQQTQDELMGLGCESMNLGVFSLAAKYGLVAESLREALFRMTKFYGTVSNAVSFSLEENGDEAAIKIALSHDEAEHDHILTEFLLIVMHRYCSWLVGRFIPIHSACFSYEEPEHSAEYQLMYATVCEFSKDKNALIIPSELLGLPIIQNKGSLAEYLEKLPADWFKRQHYRMQAASQVMRAFQQSVQLKHTQITDIASAMNITDRTLRRRLAREGANFQRLKDQFRRDKAIQLLSKSDLSISNIASELGFTEPNAFTRAFKQWTGSTPTSYRPQLSTTN